MLMVVFGAGASYDSVPSRPPKSYPPHILPERPPLANELFEDRGRFTEAMSRFRECQPIIPLLRNLKGNSVELVLEGLQEEAATYPEGFRQLTAIRYYLHFMLWECVRFWNDHARGITNYKSLLDQIERQRKPQDRVYLVTFNYDTMLEADLPTVGVTINSIGAYIANHTYKFIKLHGSVNWAREVNTPIEGLQEKNTWQVAHELIERAAALDISQRYRMVDSHPIGKVGESVIFPAIALPIETKRNYECPTEHLDALNAFLPEVTKLLLIGWRATERPFLSLLRDRLRRGVRVLTVAGGGDEANEISQRLSTEGINGEFLMTEGGFTDLIEGRQADGFLGS